MSDQYWKFMRTIQIDPDFIVFDKEKKCTKNRPFVINS